jgi:hypothetical protein
MASLKFLFPACGPAGIRSRDLRLNQEGSLKL